MPCVNKPNSSSLPHQKAESNICSHTVQRNAAGKADLEVQDDLVAVISREVLLHVGTGGAAQRVKAAVCVDINDHRHCGCVCHQR